MIRSMPQTRPTTPTRTQDSEAPSPTGTTAPEVRANAELVKETTKHLDLLDNVLICFKRLTLSGEKIDVTGKMDHSTLVHLRGRLEQYSRLLNNSKDALHRTNFPANDNDQRLSSNIEQSLYAARDKVAQINYILTH